MRSSRKHDPGMDQTYWHKGHERSGCEGKQRPENLSSGDGTFGSGKEGAGNIAEKQMIGEEVIFNG